MTSEEAEAVFEPLLPLAMALFLLGLWAALTEKEEGWEGWRKSGHPYR